VRELLPNKIYIVTIGPGGEYFAFDRDAVTRPTIKAEVGARGGDPRLIELCARATAAEAIKAARPYLKFAREGLLAEQRKQEAMGSQLNWTQAKRSFAAPLFPEHIPYSRQAPKGTIPKLWHAWRLRRLIRSFQS